MWLKGIDLHDCLVFGISKSLLIYLSETQQCVAERCSLAASG